MTASRSGLCRCTSASAGLALLMHLWNPNLAATSTLLRVFIWNWLLQALNILFWAWLGRNLKAIYPVWHLSTWLYCMHHNEANNTHMRFQLIPLPSPVCSFFCFLFILPPGCLGKYTPVRLLNREGLVCPQVLLSALPRALWHSFQLRLFTHTPYSKVVVVVRRDRHSPGANAT